jgi:metal-dependent hydrolase (beta-lactamase superfamily II)
MFNVHSLPASFGDSLLIEYGEDTDLHYILIDGGPYYAYADLISAIHNIAPTLKEIELLVITHIDIDHIDGIVKLLNQDALPFNINEVWFNGYKQLIELQEEDDDTLGAVQGEYLSYLIETKQLNHNTQFAGKAVMVKDNRNLPHITLKGCVERTYTCVGERSIEKNRRHRRYR